MVDHKDLVEVKPQLVYSDQEKLEKAERLGTQMLGIRKSALGEDNPDTLSIWHQRIIVKVGWKRLLCYFLQVTRDSRFLDMLSANESDVGNEGSQGSAG